MNVEYFVVSPWIAGFYFLYCHKYWACDCDLEMQMRTNRPLTKTAIWWNNVEVFALSPRAGFAVYSPAHWWWPGNQVLCFSYRSRPLLLITLVWSEPCGSEAEKARIWQIVIT